MSRRRNARAIAALLVAATIACGLSGCFRHKAPQPQAVVLPPQLPVALETPPGEANATLVEAPKQTKLPAVPVAEAATKPRRLRRKPKPVPVQAQAPAPPAVAPTAPAATTQVVPAPVQTASLAGPSGAETVIGSLTPGGGNETPQARQDTQELLTATDKRLNALPTQVQHSQRKQISQVRNFWKQAQEALQTGDAEGAKTLATKAKLLLDDVEKAGQ